MPTIHPSFTLFNPSQGQEVLASIPSGGRNTPGTGHQFFAGQILALTDHFECPISQKFVFLDCGSKLERQHTNIRRAHKRYIKDPSRNWTPEADLSWVELRWDSLKGFLKTPIYQYQCWRKCFHDNCNIAVWCTALRFDERILFLWPQELWLELYRLEKIHHDIFKQEKVQNKSIFIEKKQDSVPLLTTYTLHKCSRFWWVNSVTAASTSISTLGGHLLRLSGLPHTPSASLTKCTGNNGVPILTAGKNGAITAFLSLACNSDSLARGLQLMHLHLV